MKLLTEQELWCTPPTGYIGYEHYPKSEEKHNMSERRTFTAVFKAKVVLEMLSGQKSSAEICREYNIGAPLLSSWKTQFLEGVEQVFQGDERSNNEQARIAELERLAEQQALEIEVLKKASSLLPAPRCRNGRSA